MISTGEPFPADYSISTAQAGQAEFVLRASPGRTPSRAVRVRTGDGRGGREWSAAVAVPPALTRSACSGEHAGPRPDVLVLVEQGTAFWVEVRHPEQYRVVRTDGPVTEVLPDRRSGLLLLVTPWAITALSADGPTWTTRRIAVDGLRVDEAGEGWVRGVADPSDDEPRDFAVNLDTGDVVGGSGID